MNTVVFFVLLSSVVSVAYAQTATRHRSYEAVPPGLDALMERQGVKPYDLFCRDDALMTHRVIFRDLSFGTTVWMLDFSPTVDHADTASVWSPWNPDGSTLYVGGARPRAEGLGLHHGWFFDAGFSRLRPGAHVSETGHRTGSRPAVWSPENPDLYYAPINPSSRVIRTNWRTGEQTVVAEWDPMTWAQSGQRIYGLTSDGRHIFVDTPNRGIWVPFQPLEDAPIPRLRMYDGRPVFPDGTIQGSENRFPVIYGHRRYGDRIGLRTGLLIDRKTGEITNIAAPLCGNVNYLRAFHEGRVQYPRGDEWDAYGLSRFKDDVSLPEGLSMEELRDLWLNLPHATHGHESMSPDREYIAVDWGSLIQRVRDGATPRFHLTTNGENYHLHWQRHPRYFVSWVRGWRMSYGGHATGREFTAVNNANIEFQVFCDGTAQPIVNTHHRFNAYYAGGDFSMLSPDATKIHYGSSMTGRFRNYVAVVARPRPPSELSWRADGDAVVMSWQPSAYSRETRGYLVYRGETSGGPYALKTVGPVEATNWRDETIASGWPHYYVVTSLDHSGLESGYSAEAAYVGIGLPDALDAPRVVYVEAESPLFDLRTGVRPGLAVGADRLGASDGYYLYRHPDVRNGTVELTVNIPAAGVYRLWARMRAEGANAGQWTIAVNDLTHTLSVSAAEWTWIRAEGEGVSLPVGGVTLTLATADVGAQMDVLGLATSADFVPEGPRPENRTPPRPPTALRAENTRERVNRLVWKASGDPGFSHYQVYASREAADFVPNQATLIGSPTQAELIDWGLRADTRYFYAVTAVDRQGNESAPVRAEAATPSRAFPPFEKELAFVEAELTGEFERSDAADLRAAQYVVPRQPGMNRAVWKVEIPRQGPYYLWLRHLLRGTGSRGADVRQEIRALVNGQHVVTLGGGPTDLNAPDTFIAEGHPLAEQLWTWAWPGEANLEPVMLPAGEIELALENFPDNVRYDVLLITDEPSYVPPDGRLRQR